MRLSNAFGRVVVLLAAPVFGLCQASAQAPDQHSALAQCVWEKVPTSASNWLQIGKLKRGRNHAPDSKGYALQFRLMAACGNRDTIEAFALHQALLAAKPAAVGPDLIEPRAARCDMFFEDDLEMERVAGVDWIFGDESGTPPRTQRSMFGKPLTGAEMNALMTGKKIGQTLRRLETVASEGVRTYAEGMASGESFVLGRGMGLRRCRIVQADGSLTEQVRAEAEE